MITLGISSDYHDSSVAVIIDGEIKSVLYEDRYTYVKHDKNFPVNAIFRSLEMNKLQTSDIDHVAYYEDPLAKSVRQLTSSLTTFPFGISCFSQTLKKSAHNLLVRYNLAKSLNINVEKIYFVPHHLSHASSAFSTSGHNESAVVVVDAVGEWTTTSIWKAKITPSDELEIVPIDFVSFPKSIGLFYSTMTSFLGFKVNDGECSTMALAAFGKPTYLEKINQIISPREDGLFNMDLGYFNYNDPSRPAFNKKLISLLGNNRTLDQSLGFSCFSTQNDFPDIQKWADIACSTQVQLERLLFGLFNRAHLLTGSENICFTGGVALNCVANKKIIEKMKFKSLYIPPDPGDGGSAIGAALYINSLKRKRAPLPQKTSIYMGEEASRKKSVNLFESIIQQENIKKVFTTDKFEILNPAKEDFYKIIATEIYNKKVIGIIHDRAEIGPRALGNRSILARADDIELAKFISKKIKIRAEFRPYACSLLEEDALTHFEPFKMTPLHHWMQTSVTIKNSSLDFFKAVKHTDNSTRPQICSETDNPNLFSILKEYKTLSGIGCVLNTSLNEAGMAIAKDGIDGLLFLAQTKIDLLAIDGTIIKRRPHENI